MLYNYGSHYIDQLLSIVDEDWKSIHAAVRTIASVGDADDVVKVVMETTSGILLDIDINMAAALPSTPLMIYGQYGTARMEENDSWKLRYLNPAELPEIRMEEAMAYSIREYPHEDLPWHEEYLPAEPDAQLGAFYDGCYRCFTHTGDPLVPIAETRRLVRAIDAAQAMCYPSNTQGKPGNCIS